MADSTLVDLAELLALEDADLFYVFEDPAGAAVDRKVSFATLRAALTPVSVDDPKLWTADLGYDQEFDRAGVTALPAGWSWVNQGTATYREEFGAGVISVPVRAGTWDWKAAVRSIAAAGAAWTATMKLHAIGRALGSFYPATVLLRDSTTGKFVSFTAWKDGHVYIDQWTNETTYSGNVLDMGDVYGAPPGAIRYFRVKKNSATSYDFAVSPDGRAWMTVLAGHNPSGFLTIDQVGFGAMSDTTPGAVDCEWLRVR